jgi:hypothetical protein
MSGRWGILKTIATATAIAAMAMLLPAGILAMAGQPQSAIVVFAGTIDPASLPTTVTILSWSGHVARLDGIDAVTARRLYGQGAALVMPFRKSGCMAYRKA